MYQAKRVQDLTLISTISGNYTIPVCEQSGAGTSNLRKATVQSILASSSGNVVNAPSNSFVNRITPTSGNITPLSVSGGINQTVDIVNLANRFRIMSGGLVYLDNSAFASWSGSNSIINVGPLTSLNVSGNTSTVGFGYSQVYDNGLSGASKNISWLNGNMQKITLDDNCTVTFTAPSKPCTLSLQTYQGIGSKSFTFPGTVKTTTASGITLTTTSGALDILALEYDGTNYYTKISYLDVR